MTHKIRGVDEEKYAYYVNKLRQNVGLEAGLWRQIVTLQRAHSKYKWSPYATEWTPPWKFFAYATVFNRFHFVLIIGFVSSYKIIVGVMGYI